MFYSDGLDAARPEPFVLELICCGRADGYEYCESWDEAEEFRRSYTDDRTTGHERCAILRRSSDDTPEPAEPCELCGGMGCEEGCGDCEHVYAGPDSHKVCPRCGGSGLGSPGADR